MIGLKALRYVRLGTSDSESAGEYARKVLGLELVRREGESTYFRGDDRDHTLVYFEGDPANHATGWEVSDRSALAAAGAELEAKRIRATPGTRSECEQRYVDDFLWFADPSGNRHELVVSPRASSTRFSASREIGRAHV